MKKPVTCPLCGQVRMRKPSQIATGMKYCSLKCAYGARRVKPNPTSKICRGCNLSLPIDKFAPHHVGTERKHSLCIACNCARLDKWAADNPEKAMASTRESVRKWSRRNKDKQAQYKRAHELKIRYGLTVEGYRAMCEAQGDRCAICHKLVKGIGRSGKLHVDHDHNTGQIRGLLCSACNLALGAFGDTLESIRRVYAYLKKNSRTAQSIRSEDGPGLFDQGSDANGWVQ